MTKGYIKCERFIVLSNGLEIDNNNYYRKKYSKEVQADKEIKEFGIWARNGVRVIERSTSHMRTTDVANGA